MNRLLTLSFLAAAVLVPTSAANAASVPASPTSTFSVVNGVGIPAPKLAAIEHAVAAQANGAFRQSWHTPRISFSAAGIPVLIEPVAEMQKTCGAKAASCHAKTTGATPTPYILLSTLDGLSVNLSHEVLETLADPLGTSRINGRLIEVCDPVETHTYTLDHVSLSDYVTHAFYLPGTTGRTDFMRVMG